MRLDSFYNRESGTAKRVHEITGLAGGTTTVTYVGSSKVGADASKPVWQIMKVTEVVAGDETTTTITFPNGSDKYGFVWNDHETFSYL